MRSSRVKLLLGGLFTVFLLFALVNAHGDHDHKRHIPDDLEEDEPTPSSSPEPESTPPKSVELPTFTVFAVYKEDRLLLAYDYEGSFY
jgi:hypothetical protein